MLAAVLTVPLAEESAFRGYLVRRLISWNFESVSFRRLSWFALLVSSAAFGLLHSGYWIAGSIAGILFALAMIRRGQSGMRWLRMPRPMLCWPHMFSRIINGISGSGNYGRKHGTLLTPMSSISLNLMHLSGRQGTG